MTMTVVVTRNAPERVRGFLASCMLEIAPGVYTAPRMNQGIRERVWKVLEDWWAPEAERSVLMTWLDETRPCGQDLRSLGTLRHDLHDEEGIVLARRALSPEDSPPPGDSRPDAVVSGPPAGPAPAEAWCVLDTESTGMGSEAEIIAVAVADSRGELVFDRIVRPTSPFERDRNWTTRIEPSALAHAPLFTEIAAELAAAIAGKTVIAFNAPFDERLLRQTFARYRLTMPRAEWICALDLYERKRGVRTSLTSACEREGIAIDHPHTASGDVRMLYRLYRKLVDN